MAESGVSSGKSETDITVLKETLQAQQQLLQKLYAELDQEREAAATAASETLSMILRLQGEKAAMKMEASQYKRLVEEKMCHAENSLAIFEELIYQKEMEISSLEYQVQAYRYKLMSMGCPDVGSGEYTFPEAMLLQRSDLNNGETCSNDNIRRLHSLPVLGLKGHSLQSTIEREKSLSPMSEMISKLMMQDTNPEVISQRLQTLKRSTEPAGGSFDSYSDQIRKLDERVKEISEWKEGQGETSAKYKDAWHSCSSHSPPTSKITWDQTRGLHPDQVNCEGSMEEGESIVDSHSCSNVYDVFEVPMAVIEDYEDSEHPRKGHDKLISEAESRLTKPDSFSEEILGSQVKDETNKLNDIFCSTNSGFKLSNTKDKIAILGQKKDAISVDCNFIPVSLGNGSSEYLAEVNRLSQRIERLEGERNVVRQEISVSDNEELRLLKDIHEQLSSIKSEIRSLKTKKSSKHDDYLLRPVQEAMLYFWL